jgi:ABC-type multidrug transport system fused ATPase/permease subunit
VVSRFISDISMAQNFVGSAMINIWMDGVSLGFVIWLLFRGFVDSLSDKLDTLIGEGGVRPSTGQRQRLVLARVFLKNPPILILDEATSGLDSEVENLIHDAVRRLMKGRTSFLIAHRLSNAVGADVIVVLDSGRIVEVGSHLALVKRAGVYARSSTSRRASCG